MSTIVQAPSAVAYKPMLYVSGYVPCTLAGAPVIVRQLLEHYDMQKLHMLCDQAWYQNARRTCSSSLLDCKYYPISSYITRDLRPRRIAARLRGVLNFTRTRSLIRKGIELCRLNNIECIFAPLHAPEFALAALEIHRATKIPYYVFETDDLTQINSNTPFISSTIKRVHPELLREATVSWMTSPSMVDSYRQRFGVEGKFLFHFVDPAKYFTPCVMQATSPLKLIYTGSINAMFHDTLKQICKWINDGLHVGGHIVTLDIFTGSQVAHLVGTNVRHGGFVDHSQVPKLLSDYHGALVAVSFSDEPGVRQLVATSLFTKTIDYLAARLPVIYVGPDYTAEYAYFEQSLNSVLTLNPGGFESTLNELASGKKDVADRIRYGFDLVHSSHSPNALRKHFLEYFSV